jgi:hypothetical protein
MRRFSNLSVALSLFLATLFPAFLSAGESSGAKRAKWRSMFSMKMEPLASNYSSTCRRPFGAGLYDAAAGKTFVCWNGPGMSICARAYDHASRSWSGEITACKLDFSKRYVYHNYPVLRLAPDGRLVVYFCNHSGQLFQVKAPHAHSIEGDWTKTEISIDQNAYPMPIVSGKNIYVFYSKNDEITWPYRTYRYVKSADSGTTWTEPATVIDSEKKEPAKFDEVYAAGICYNPESGRIGITWSMGGGKAHYSASRDLYFAWFNTRTDRMENAAGRDLGTAILFDELDACCVIKSPGDPDAPDRRMRYPITRPQPSFIRKTGAPVIAFGIYKPGTGDLACFMRWEGDAWKLRSMLPAPKTFCDLESAGADEFRILCRDGSMVMVFRSTNAGLSWSECSSSKIKFEGKDNRVMETLFIEDSQPPAVGFLGTSFRDPTKEGGYNYDGMFRNYIIMAK